MDHVSISSFDIDKLQAVRALCPEVFSQQTEEYARLGIVPFLNGVLKGGAGLPPEMRAQSVGIGTAGGYASPQIAFDNIVTQAIIEDPWLREAHRASPPG